MSNPVDLKVNSDGSDECLKKHNLTLPSTLALFAPGKSFKTPFWAPQFPLPLALRTWEFPLKKAPPSSPKGGNEDELKLTLWELPFVQTFVV